MSALTPPETKRGSLFVGTRVPTKTVAAAPPELVSISTLAAVVEDSNGAVPIPAPAPGDQPVAHEPAVETTPRAEAPQVAAETTRAEAIAATEAMPWLFADPGASAPVGADAALSALPSFDRGVAPHDSETAPDAGTASPNAERFDAAVVLESIAGRIRRGEIDVNHGDAGAGEATVLATVLAALLRQQGR